MPYRLAALAAAVIALGPGRAPAQAPAPAIDQTAQNDRPKFLVRVSVDKEYRVYAEGETLKLNVRCEEDAYLYVLYQQSDGKVFQIFPNSGQPDNRIKGKQDVHVPELDDMFRWVVAPPFGKEIVKVIASKKPVDALSLPGLKEDRFNPVTVEQVEGAGQQLKKEPANVWSEHDLSITTVRKGEPTTPPDAHKRFGVFFGVSKYEFNEAKVAAFGPEADNNLTLPENDAEDMARVLTAAARLTDAHTYKNEQVTKDRVREEVTAWLPSVSRPGDTVFIFFSGHGSPILDDDSDEADQTDEVLNTYGSLNATAFAALNVLKKKGMLPPQWEPLVTALGPDVAAVWQQAYAAAGGDANQDAANQRAAAHVTAFLSRRTDVSDDELGHWLQKLDGRHVVVITDACRSGGLATPNATGTKGLTGPARAPARPAGFNFLKKSLLRLKDLNQPSMTLLAAASEQQNSLENKLDRNGWFTGFLLERLNAGPGPVDARQAWEYCNDKIAMRFAALNAALAAQGKEAKPVFEPQLVSTETAPVVLKPGP
jgi:hypothetical protein